MLVDEILFSDCTAYETSGWLPLLLIQESNKEGKTWRVMIIKTGWSKNNIYYPSEVLKKARPLFEGSKVYAYQFKGHYFDHLPDDAVELAKQGFAKNLTGWFDDVKYEEVNGTEGLTANFHITDNFFKETFKNAWEEGKKDLLGFSIDAKGELMPAVIGGRKGKKVTELKIVNETDIVTQPAAGGKLLRLVASRGQGLGVGGERQGDFGADVCVCPKCGFNIPHEKGTPCLENLCPSCGIKLIGGNKMNEELKKLIEMIRENPEILGVKEDVNLQEKTDEELLVMLEEALDNRDAKKKKKEEEEAEEAKKKKKEEGETEESKKKKEEDEKMKAAQLSEVEITPAVLGKIVEMLKGEKVDDALDMIEGMLTNYKKKKETGYPAKTSEEEPGKEVEELKKKMGEVDEKFKELAVKEAQMKLKETLATVDLPQIVKDKVLKQFEGQVFEEAKLKESIDAETEVLAKLTESDTVTGLGSIHLGKDTGDKLQIALHKLMGVEPTDEEKEEWRDVPVFRGIREAYNRYTGDVDVRGVIDQRITEAVSGNFPQALGVSMERRLVKEYTRVPISQAWRKFVTIDSPSNFKTQDLIRLGGLGDLPIVAEDGNYTEWPAGVPGEEKASYNIAKRGKIFRITREMIKNDDLRIVRKIPVKMGQTAARTLAKFVFDLVLNYAGGAMNGGTIYDALALYHANHNNYTTDELNTTSLDLGITAMGNQTEQGSGEPLGIQAQYLLVAHERRSLAKILIDSEKRPIVATAGETGTIESINPNYKAVEPIIVPNGYLRNDTNNWFLLAKKEDLEYIVVGFLDGRETPEILLQDSPTVDVVFTNDRIRYKIRHEYSGVNVDYRGYYGGIVTGLS